MIVPVVLNGWGSSSRRGNTRTHALVARALLSHPTQHFPVLGLRAMILRSRSRKVLKHILHHESPDHVLLCVGKSLGARNIVERVLNRLNRPLKYKAVFVVTIDPCWPVKWNLAPNLNGVTLHLEREVDRAVNIYVVAKRPKQQAGAILRSDRTESVANIPIVDADHYSIVRHPTTKSVVTEVVTKALDLLKG